jgi:hypothetical protein
MRFSYAAAEQLRKFFDRLTIVGIFGQVLDFARVVLVIV